MLLERKAPMKPGTHFLVFFVILIVLVGCSQSTPVPEIIEVTAAPSPTATHTNTPKPTETPTPLPPTNTPLPTNTPRPTHTPTPTPSPTPVPNPVIYNGTGDSIVDVEKPKGFMLMHITGNASRRHFAVTSYDSNNDRLELYVNTTDPFDGLLLLDYKDSHHTARFEVKATGAWSVEIMPFVRQYVPVLELPATAEGTGPYFYGIVKGTPDKLYVSVSTKKHIAVYGWSNSGRKLLVNEVGPYEGTVLLSRDTVFLEVITDGQWKIEVFAK